MLTPLATLLLLLPPTSQPDARGLAIAQAGAAADRGVQAEVATATLTLQTSRGRSEERVFRLTTLQGDPERRLIELLAPARHKGLKVLTRSPLKGDEEVFIYFPRHDRTRRIAGRKRSGRFLQSDLTFEDLGSRRPDRFRHHWLRDDTLDGVPCHVVEATPKNASESGYQKLRLWRQVGTYRLLKVTWYDRDTGRLLKTGRFSDWTQVGRWWRANTTVIRNAETGNTTTLRFRDRMLPATVDPSTLTPNALDR